MLGDLGSDIVITKLDELRRRIIAAGFLEDEADAPIAFRIGQDLISVQHVDGFSGLLAA